MYVLPAAIFERAGLFKKVVLYGKVIMIEEEYANALFNAEWGRLRRPPGP